MMTEGTNLLVLTISAFWSSSRWVALGHLDEVALGHLDEVALGHLDELQKAEKYPIRWSL